MQLHLDMVLRPVPDPHVLKTSHFQKSFTGIIPCSLFSHQPIMPDPVLTPSTAKLPCDSPRDLFIAGHTIYLSNSKYGKNHNKYDVSETDTIRHLRLRARVLITDPERVIFSSQCCTMRRELSVWLEKTRGCQWFWGTVS